LRGDRVLNASNRFVHSLHEIWRVQVIELGIEELRCSFSRCYTAHHQQSRHNRRNLRFARKSTYNLFVYGFDQPAQSRNLN
jgi:hypothetical protein